MLYLWSNIIRSSPCAVPLQSSVISTSACNDPRVKYLAMEPFRFFSNWSEYQPVDKGDLVYGGVSDCERCYYDHGRLRNWEQGHVPMEEHARLYSECPHILLVRRHTYIEGKSYVDEEGNTGFFADGAFNSGDSYIKSVAAQSCLEMGFSRENVVSAISVFLQRYGNNDFKGADLCEILYEIEEAMENNTAESAENLQKDHSLTQKQVCKLCVASLDHLSLVAFNHVLGCPQCFPWFLRLPVDG